MQINLVQANVPNSPLVLLLGTYDNNRLLKVIILNAYKMFLQYGLSTIEAVE